jgi:hypothetical protein
MAYSECLPTRLNPRAEGACFFQVPADAAHPDRRLLRRPGRDLRGRHGVRVLAGGADGTDRAGAGLHHCAV